VTRIRDYTDADADAVAALNAAGRLSQCLDFESRSGPDLRSFDAVFPRRHADVFRFVAEDPGGRIVGYAHGFGTAWQPAPGRFWASIRVDPASRGHGVGRALSDALSAALTARGVRELRVELREPEGALGDKLAAAGFRELFRSWEFELDLATSPVTAPQPPEGLILRSLAAELRDGDADLQALRDLYVAVNADIPLPAHPDPDMPLDAFVDYVARWPTALPEATLVAREGDRPIGLCILQRFPDDPAVIDHHFTGVHASARGRGLARVLKHWTIAESRRMGFARVRTIVESNNPPMLAVNARLGFERRGGVVVLQRG
jgi:mycothiol synthase